MEKKDLELLGELAIKDYELKKLVDKHFEYEKKLDEFGSRMHLSPSEEVEKKQLQKQKLAGKDRIERKLAQYREN